MKTKIVILIVGIGLFIAGWWIGTIKLRRDVYVLMMDTPLCEFGNINPRFSKAAKEEQEKFYKDLRHYAQGQSLALHSRVLWEAKYAFEIQSKLEHGSTNSLSAWLERDMKEFIAVHQNNNFNGQSDLLEFLTYNDFSDSDIQQMSEQLAERINNYFANQSIEPIVTTPVD